MLSISRERHHIDAVPGYLRGRPELEQAVLRMAFGLVAIVAYAWPTESDSGTELFLTQLMLGLFELYGVFSYIAVRRRPAHSPSRLLLTTFLDQCLLAITLVAGGQAALPFVFVIFWLLVGAGCRYGKGPLALSATTASAGLYLLTAISPWWIANRPAALGLLIAVVTTSVYLYVLVARIEHRARTDGMTGLLNRSSLDEALHQTFSRIGHQNQKAALFLIDLDGFKEVNDTFGHAVGDDLLQRFAQGLRLYASRRDLVARLGGDEFVVFSSRDWSKDEAARRADLVHCLLENIRRSCVHSRGVSASIGIVLIKSSEKERLSVRTVMMRADQAMYLAKQRGKNGTVFADELSEA